MRDSQKPTISSLPQGDRRCASVTSFFQVLGLWVSKPQPFQSWVGLWDLTPSILPCGQGSGGSGSYPHTCQVHSCPEFQLVTVDQVGSPSFPRSMVLLSFAKGPSGSWTYHLQDFTLSRWAGRSFINTRSSAKVPWKPPPTHLWGVGETQIRTPLLP